MKINKNYLQLEESYLFSTIAKKVNAFIESHPDKKVIKLGIGDVTNPLCETVLDALHSAVDDMGQKETFKGYGPEQGYGFLRDAIKDYYGEKNVVLASDEVFVSDGAKSDLGNILDIFDQDNTVWVQNPVYPVYVDTNKMAGRTILFMDGNLENDFLPMPNEEVDADVIYLCSPNNPTGAVYSREQLKVWVDYANAKGAVILFDAAYEAFIEDETLPRSIYEIEGAKTCAIEFCSFSKTAGFTGTRCGYTVVPHDLVREEVKLNKLWLRRQTTKFNGVPYIVQKAAAAVFTQEGRRQTKESIAVYKENAQRLCELLDKKSIPYVGGKNAPYVWLKCPEGKDSWTFFDELLENYFLVGTPGVGFGTGGEGYFRLTAFGDVEETKEAVKRLEVL